MKKLFLSGVLLLSALVSSPAGTVVYEGPVVYQGPVIYYGPVLYQASVIYQFACDPFLTAFSCGQYSDSSPVIYTGRGLRQLKAELPCQSPTVIFFGHEQARRQGYQFTKSR